MRVRGGETIIFIRDHTYVEIVLMETTILSGKKISAVFRLLLAIQREGVIVWEGPTDVLSPDSKKEREITWDGESQRSALEIKEGGHPVVRRGNESCWLRSLIFIHYLTLSD